MPRDPGTTNRISYRGSDCAWKVSSFRGLWEAVLLAKRILLKLGRGFWGLAYIVRCRQRDINTNMDRCTFTDMCVYIYVYKMCIMYVYINIFYKGPNRPIEGSS